MGSPDPADISTSHVERHNLTTRTLMRPFIRLPLGFGKKPENLEAARAVFLAFYKFCWRSRDVVEGGNRLPAATAAGVAGTLMSFEQLFDTVMGGGYAMAA
jgi:hypothetical protein